MISIDSDLDYTDSVGHGIIVDFTIVKICSEGSEVFAVYRKLHKKCFQTPSHYAIYYINFWRPLAVLSVDCSDEDIKGDNR